MPNFGQDKKMLIFHVQTVLNIKIIGLTLSI
jgi:hypothetical protein